MGKNTARIRTGDKRLLGVLIYRRLVRPAAIFLFCCAAAAFYGQQGGHFVEVTLGNNELSIDQELEIEIIIKHEAPYLQNNSDMPRFLLEHEADAAQLIQSSTIPERDGLYLRYRYRFNKTGTFRFQPELHWRRQTVELEPLDITVHWPMLSEHTPFVWQLYTVNGQPLPQDDALEQGREYVLCLTAAFYSAGYTERYLNALQSTSVHPASVRTEDTRPEAGRSEVSRSETAHSEISRPKDIRSEALRTQESRSGAAIRDIPGELPLPAEILRIECSPSESAALKPLTLSELPFDTPVLSETAGDEHYVLAIFSLIPLRIGAQSLPQAQIRFATGGEAFSVPAAYRIERQTAAETAGTGAASRAGGFTAAAFQALPPETQYSGSGITEQEKAVAAQQIAEYRKQEAASLLAPAIRRERKKVEAALGITRPLPLYPRLFGILTAAISGLLLIGAAVYGFRNKKKLMLLLIIAGLCSGGFTVVLFRRILQPQGVYTGGSDPAVRRIPETSGGNVYRLSAGESVIIIRRAPHWYYIKTAGGVTGWVVPQSIMQYN